MTIGGESQTGRRPLRRERARPPKEKALWLRGGVTERSRRLKSEREWVGRDARPWFGGGRAREAKKLKRAVRPRFELNTRIRNKGHGWFGGRKPSRRRCKAEGFYGKARGRKGKWEITCRPTDRRKALKSAAQERWGLK